MMDEQELRDRLGAADVPASRLQVQALVTGGRRRAWRRRTVQAGCGAALAAAVVVVAPAVWSHPGAAPPPADGSGGGASCPAERLPVPPGSRAVSVHGVDPSGRYAVGNDTLAGPVNSTGATDGTADTIGRYRPVLWTDGRPVVLPGVDKSTATSAVNASGTVVGMTGSRTWDAIVRWTDGTPAKLVPPAGEWTFPGYPRINATGDIVANARRADGSTAVLFWGSGTVNGIRLPLPAGAEALDITGDGDIVGQVLAGREMTDMSSYRWDRQGRGQQLAAPPGQHAAVQAAQGSWATGSVWPSGAAARWDLRTGEVLPLDVHAPARAVNAEGWVVSDGTVLGGDSVVRLATLDGAAGEATDIADNGVVVGNLRSDTGERRSAPVTWTCTP